MFCLRHNSRNNSVANYLFLSVSDILCSKKINTFYCFLATPLLSVLNFYYIIFFKLLQMSSALNAFMEWLKHEFI